MLKSKIKNWERDDYAKRISNELLLFDWLLLHQNFFVISSSSSISIFVKCHFKVLVFVFYFFVFAVVAVVVFRFCSFYLLNFYKLDSKFFAELRKFCEFKSSVINVNNCKLTQSI